MQKKAEKKLTDAGKFPIESCRERIARRFGENAVAMSGPCEGSSLVGCVCQQLQDRWDKIGDKLAGSERKAIKVAMRLAQTYSAKDDTQACVADLEKLGFEKTAASGIADYLKAFAIEKVAMDELDGIVDDVSGEPDVADDMGFGGEPVEEPAVEGEEEPSEEEFVEDEGAESPMEGPVEDLEDENVEVGLETPELGGPPELGENTVTIELPQEVADELMLAISGAAGKGGEETDLAGPGPDLMGDVVELGAEGEEVPGEPAGAQEPGVQVVTGEPPVPPPANEEACGGTCSADGGKMVDESKPHFPGESKEEHKEHEASESPVEEKKEHEGGKPEGEEKHESEHEKSETKHEEHKEHEEGDEEKEEKEAAMMLRAGRLRRVGQTILRLAPEMSLNNTDQQAGGKPLGTAKEKAVEKPEPLSEGNVKPEGFTAGGNKFQDGSTMGKEQKFDAKTVSKDDVSKGEASLMGKDESLPKGGPDIPAGSAPLGNEKWQGGDVSTKGTVIATFTPKGLVVETPEGKKFLAKASIKNVPPGLVESVGKIPYDGDGRKFAASALKLIREAKCTCEDGVMKTDTSKLEGKNFTNDGEKKPDEGGAVAGKKGSPAKEEGVTKTDTSKLEATKFTNDEEKKAEANSDVKTLLKQASYLNKVECTPELLKLFTDNVKLAFRPPGMRPDEREDRVDLSQMIGQERDVDSGIKNLVEEIKSLIAKGADKNSPELQELKSLLEAPRMEAPLMASSDKAVKTAEEKTIKDPKPVAENLETEGYSAGDKKFQDGSTLGKEQKFDAKEVKKEDVSKGDASLMGNEKRDLGGIPTDKPEVPAGGGKMGNETWDGGNVETKGTVIASEENIQKRLAEARKQAENEAKVREARLASAAALAADMLRHGEIDEKEYQTKVTEISAMPVPAIQQLALTVRQTRQRLSAKAAVQAEPRVASLNVPIIPQNANNEDQSLVQRLTREFKLTKQLNALDDMNK